MGTVIVGNKNIGDEYLTEQPVMNGYMISHVPMELYKKNDGIVVYEFKIPYDQVDDGDLAIEFYYYFKKPTTQAFYDKFYKAEDFYIFPLVVSADDDGNFWSLGTLEQKKISLVGRNDGWIHVTLHLDEYMWGTFSSEGKTYYNPWYFGIYSPLLNFCWDYTSKVNGTPYQLEWACWNTFKDYDYFDHIVGGEFGEAYKERYEIPFYPSFYYTYKDITIDSIAYKTAATSKVNVTSKLVHNSKFIKFVKEKAAMAETIKRQSKLKRQLAESFALKELKTAMHRIVLEIIDDFKIDECTDNSRIVKRLMSEASYVTDLLKRQLKMFARIDSDVLFDSEAIRKLLISRFSADDVEMKDLFEKQLDFSRLIRLAPVIKTDIKRKSELFRYTNDESVITARPFASRLFFRVCSTVVTFWDFLRGKIREANNIVSLYCPIDLEIELECKI